MAVPTLKAQVPSEIEGFGRSAPTAPVVWAHACSCDATLLPGSSALTSGSGLLTVDAQRAATPARRVLAVLILGLALFGWACGDSCTGFTSFTDSNGLIVLVGCDGSSFVVTPTPGSTSSGAR